MKSSRSPADIERYLGDESRLGGGHADEVFWPATPAEAADVLAACAARRQPVTVAGAGTGVVGGRVPFGGALLSLERLDRIEVLDERPPHGGGLLRAGAGALLAEVQQAAAAHRLLYPPDPTETGASIGGTIATNASGSRTFRFGPTRHWVRRLLVALADGTLLDLPRGRCTAADGSFTVLRPDGPPFVVPAPRWSLPAARKHVAGYHSAPGMDLVDLFVGSEGTLGVVLEADLVCVDAPDEILAGILFFANDEAAFGLVDAARRERAAVRPLCLEYFDAAALDLLRTAGVSVPEGARTAILFEQDAAAAEVDALTEAWVELAAEHEASDESWVAGDPAEHRKFREFRHQVPVSVNEILARRDVRKISTDTAVPPGRLGEMLAAFRRELDAAGLEHIAFGHVGDDHVHMNVIPRDEAEQRRGWELYGRLLEIAVGLGGTIAGEHGLGKTKARYLPLLFDDDVVEQMRAIKSALDPAGLLGPGTVLPPKNPRPNEALRKEPPSV